MAFTRVKVAVFVDGCFWHGCPEHHTRPATNGEWWDWKIRRNQRRDEDTNQLLEGQGWAVVRVWEHEDPTDATGRVRTLVHSRRARG